MTIKPTPLLSRDPDFHAAFLTDNDLKLELVALAQCLRAAVDGSVISVVDYGVTATRGNWEASLSLFESLCLEYESRFGETSECDLLFIDLSLEPLLASHEEHLTGYFEEAEEYGSRQFDYTLGISREPFVYTGRRGVPQLVCEMLSVA
tara:strand:+ start:445 stop:891 length:447 start_codon:yes stop_codon:yes gene_type:complete